MDRRIREQIWQLPYDIRQEYYATESENRRLRRQNDKLFELCGMLKELLETTKDETAGAGNGTATAASGTTKREPCSSGIFADAVAAGEPGLSTLCEAVEVAVSAIEDCASEGPRAPMELMACLRNLMWQIGHRPAARDVGRLIAVEKDGLLRRM